MIMCVLLFWQNCHVPFALSSSIPNYHVQTTVCFYVVECRNRWFCPFVQVCCTSSHNSSCIPLITNHVATLSQSNSIPLSCWHTLHRHSQEGRRKTSPSEQIQFKSLMQALSTLLFLCPFVINFDQAFTEHWSDLPPAPLKLRPYGAIEIRLLLLLLFKNIYIF